MEMKFTFICLSLSSWLRDFNRNAVLNGRTRAISCYLDDTSKLDSEGQTVRLG